MEVAFRALFITLTACTAGLTPPSAMNVVLNLGQVEVLVTPAL